MLLRLIPIIVIIPKLVINLNFFLTILFFNEFLNFWLLWDVAVASTWFSWSWIILSFFDLIILTNMAILTLKFKITQIDIAEIIESLHPIENFHIGIFKLYDWIFHWCSSKKKQKNHFKTSKVLDYISDGSGTIQES